MNNLFKFIITGLFSISLLGAQQRTGSRENRTLHIGDKMPEVGGMQALRYSNDLVNLEEVGEKVVILDFFDTYCATCIAAMPKLQKLQDEMGNKLQIISVTWQDSATIGKFLRTNAYLQEHSVALPIIYGDTILRTLFPHKGVPHVSWLFKGDVKAITHADFINAENVNYLYNNERIDLPLKNDFEVSSNQNSLKEYDLKGSVKLTGFRDGMPVSGYKYEPDSLTGLYYSSFVNMPIFGAYTAVWGKIRKPTFVLKPERIVWKVADSTKYKYAGDSGAGQVWLSKNAISYERSEHIMRTPQEQAEVVLQDLNSLLGLKVYWATKKLNCLVIRKVDAEVKQNTVNQQDSSRQSIEGTGVLAFLLDYSGKYPPVVDEVNGKENIVIGPYNTIAELNIMLIGYGVEIVEGNREMDVLIFEEQ